MNKDLFVVNYELVLVPMLISFIGLCVLMVAGDDGLNYALPIGLALFTFGVNQMMGKSVVGDTAVMMNLLPVSAKTTVLTKVSICGLWVGVICSIPAFLMMKNGGSYIDQAVFDAEWTSYSGSTLFYRGLPQYRYALETNPTALDVAVGDLMDSGAGVFQIGLMMVLIPIILFLIGCYFALAVLITQLYLHPVMRKVPTMVVSVIGMVLGGIAALSVAFLIKGAMEQGFLNLFAGELLAAVFFGGATWLLTRVSVKRMENGFDVV